MQALVKKGKTRAIGLSNFSISELADVIPYENDIPISCNQVEVHPWLPNNKLIAFAEERGILTTCFSPFAGQKADGATLLKDETVLKLAEKNGMDVGQLLQSWAVQRRTVPLGKSSTPGNHYVSFNFHWRWSFCSSYQIEPQHSETFSWRYESAWLARHPWWQGKDNRLHWGLGYSAFPELKRIGKLLGLEGQLGVLPTKLFLKR
jgi:Aldo/keto reductase family